MKHQTRFQQDEGGFISLTMLMFSGVAFFLLWATLFSIDETVRAQGQVISTSHTQVVQAADGGVISEILVREGERVKAGQRVATLESERSSANFDESLAKSASLNAALIRARAEIAGQPPKFGPEFVNFPEFVAAQMALYVQRRRGLEEELSTLNEQLDIAKEELQMSESLLATGDTSRLEMIRSKRQVSEVQARVNAVRNKYFHDVRADTIKIEEDISSVKYKLEERQSVLSHSELNSPVDGVVKLLKVNTVGGVLRAGDEMMQISPTGAEMVIEIKINPVDIGQLKLGLPVMIKLDAFDYSIFGTLKGTLAYISSDTLTDVTGAGQTTSYYRAHIKLDEQNASGNAKLLNQPLIPGMTATADIRITNRTVLQYIAKPIYKVFQEALNER